MNENVKLQLLFEKERNNYKDMLIYLPDGVVW